MKEKKFLKDIKDIWYILCLEVQRIFSDNGVLIIFFLGGILYPILYSFVYNKDNLTEVPIAIVDNSQSAESREFARSLDATPSLKIAYRCLNIEEAKQRFKNREVFGIVYFPNDYAKRLNDGEQAYLSLYCDMSSFLYYRTISTATNSVMLNEMKNIEMRRYNAVGITGEDAEQLVNPVENEGIALFSPSEGFRSYLLPAVLIFILHQTLFFGIGLLGGTAYEEGKHYIPKNIAMNSTYRVVIGRALAYFIIYAGLGIYALDLIPRLFDLPHFGSPTTLITFLLPFLLASIFFSMTVASFIRLREATLLLFAPFTMILIFLSGFSWPSSNIPIFWKAFSYLFPSTFGVQGYIGINTLGASIGQLQPQILGLWIQAGAYFVTACLSLRWIRKKL